MKIYTGFGDRGETSLWGGTTVPKSNPQVQAYGTLDELNSLLGLLSAKVRSEETVERLRRVQEQLFTFSAEIASDAKGRSRLEGKIGSAEINLLEKEMDAWNESLPALKNFILPGGSESAALAHLARTVCRRAERELVILEGDAALRPDCLVFINRLSDWLFLLARVLNVENNVDDVLWLGNR